MNYLWIFEKPHMLDKNLKNEKFLNDKYIYGIDGLKYIVEIQKKYKL